jgi:hypothetical protein
MTALDDVQAIAALLAAAFDGRDRPAAAAHRLVANFEHQRAIIALADRHRVLGAFAAAVDQFDLDAEMSPEFAELLVAARVLYRDRNVAMTMQLESVCTTLGLVGIVPMLLKGSNRLVDGLYPDLSWRQMIDLDIYVEPVRADEAYAALAGTGYEPVHAMTRSFGQHHLPSLAKNGQPAVVEIHDHFIDFGVARALQPHHVAAETKVFGGLTVQAPDRGSQLHIAIAHGQLASYAFHTGNALLRDLLETRVLLQRCNDAETRNVVDSLAAAGYGTAARAWLGLVSSLFDGTDPGRSAHPPNRRFQNRFVRCQERLAAGGSAELPGRIAKAVIGGFGYPPRFLHYAVKPFAPSFWTRNWDRFRQYTGR